MDWIIDDAFYNAESSLEDLTNLKRHVFLIQEDIVCYNEIMNPTPFVYQIQFERIRKLTQDLDTYYLIVNVAHAKKPTAEHRATIKGELKSLFPKLKEICVISGKNYWTNTLASFILRGVGYDSLNLCGDFESAMNIINKVKTLK
ncbi:MAG: hypothetical protein OEX22_08305 [Cyclobacteriaceae bacterium]|nr:hypothetical protein [Cyclobacteriaceae bacterium]